MVEISLATFSQIWIMITVILLSIKVNEIFILVAIIEAIYFVCVAIGEVIVERRKERNYGK